MTADWKNRLFAIFTISITTSVLIIAHFENEHIRQGLITSLDDNINQYENDLVTEIDFTKIAEFSWDALYIFEPYSSCSQVVKILKSPSFLIDCQFIGIELLEYTSLFVFTKGEKIVQYFLYHVSITNPDFTSTLDKNEFTYQEAKFILVEDRMIWAGGN